MAKIQPVNYPFNEVATELIVHVQGFSTSSNTCVISYFLNTESGKQLLYDSYTLTEEEFQGWGQDNGYLDQIAASKIPVVIIEEPVVEPPTEPEVIEPTVEG